MVGYLLQFFRSGPSARASSNFLACTKDFSPDWLVDRLIGWIDWMKWLDWMDWLNCMRWLGWLDLLDCLDCLDWLGWLIDWMGWLDDSTGWVGWVDWLDDLIGWIGRLDGLVQVGLIDWMDWLRRARLLLPALFGRNPTDADPNGEISPILIKNRSKFEIS